MSFIDHLEKRYWPQAEAYLKIHWPFKVTAVVLVLLVEAFTGLISQSLDSLAVEVAQRQVEPAIAMRAVLMWLGLLLIVVFDYITGIIAAKGRGEKIGYWGLQQTFVKWTEVTCVFWAFAISDWVVVQGMMMVYVGATWVLYHELKSIIDNSRYSGKQLIRWMESKLPWIESPQSDN